MMTSSLRHLCEDMQALIEGLDASAHATESIPAPTWRHARQAFTEAVGSALDQHLLFSVTIESAPATGTAGVDSYEVEADVTVAFMYKLGAGEEIDRERLAMDAAADVVGALLSSRPLAARANVEVDQAFTPGRKAGDFLPVEVRLKARLDIAYNFQ